MARARVTLFAAQKVQCPRCGAKAETPCTTVSGGFLRIGVHVVRKLAAKEAAS